MSAKSKTRPEVDFQHTTLLLTYTTTPAGRMVFGIFASLAEFERDLISERTRA